MWGAQGDTGCDVMCGVVWVVWGWGGHRATQDVMCGVGGRAAGTY